MTLTREQIEKLEGPELSAAVAEFVMGWKQEIHREHDPQDDDYIEYVMWVGHGCIVPSPPDYSTDIAEAWDAAEKSKLFHSRDIGGCEYVLSKRGKLWVIADLIADPSTNVGIIAYDKSEKVAICRAALLWALEREES